MTNIIKTTWFPFGKYDAITLWPLIFVKRGCKDYVINHERIHLQQQKELLLVGFYLLYGLFYAELFLSIAFSDWGLSFKQVCDEAYRSNPLEREAYWNQMDMDYLNRRRHFAWFSFI